VIVRFRPLARLLTAVLLLAGCGTASAPAPAATSAAAPGLAGTAWRLIKFQSGDDTIVKPDDPAKYTVEFGADGTVTARIDCNRGRGSWTSPEPGQLSLGPLALTRVMCPPGSLHDRIVRDWSFVRTYVIQDGHLFLSLFADAGIYELEPTR
jgi:para-nitrobenzyl esterase